MVRASELHTLYEVLEEYVKQLESKILVVVPTATAGDKSIFVSRRVNAVLAKAKPFLFLLMETRVVPENVSRQVFATNSAILKVQRTPNKPWTWWAKYGAGFKYILQNWQKWPDKADLGASSDAKLTVGPFVVHNVVHAKEKQIEQIRVLLADAAKAVKKSKIPGSAAILYGDVLVAGKFGRNRTVGLYIPEKDLIYIRPLAKITHDHLKTLIHELGHRYWDKVMPRSQKAEWTTHHRAIASQDAGAIATVWPKVGDPIPFDLKGFKTRPLVTRISGGAFYVEKNGKEVGSISAQNIIRGQQEDRIQASYPTPYAATDPEEHFCESFALYSMGKLPPEHKTPFKQIIGVA